MPRAIKTAVVRPHRNRLCKTCG